MPYTSEIRLGIVFYGGVSLAIYENGVAEELFHAVHGDGVYGLLKDLMDADIIVDVISGTSAGGINGIYLGYALANARDFTQMSALWREQGDIQKLLREPGDKETLSVLNSTFYQQELAKAFRSMGDRVASPGARPSRQEALDLFVTGTDVGGEISTVLDDHGNAVDVKRHNVVFKLSWRDTRKNEFNPAFAEELATLARITSCFPVAFAPVGVDVDKLPNLARWGRLRSTATGAGGPSGSEERFDKVYLDGGILDNKPFSYTIDTIWRRTANRPVRRLLFYVEPDPESFRSPERITPPTVIQAAVNALITIPGYESIGADLAAINAHNEQVIRLSSLMNAATAAQAHTEVSLDQVRIVPEDAGDVYATARLIKLRDRVVEGILNTDGWRECFRDAGKRRAAHVLVKSFLELPSNTGTYATLERFDVYYRLRRLFHLTYAIYDPATPPVSTEKWDEHSRLWDRINHLIKVTEIIEWALGWYVDHVPIPWAELDPQHSDTAAGGAAPRYDEIAATKWAQVEHGLSEVLDNSAVKWPQREDETARQEFYTNLKAHIAELAKRVPDATKQQPQGNLLQDCDKHLHEIMREHAGSKSSQGLVREYCTYLSIDRHIFPCQFVSGVYTRDQIRIQRLSPLDAKRGHSGRLRIEEKVAGKTFGAFGGFFKKTWRANDIMWGRLDAVTQLVETLITQERMQQLERWKPLSERQPDLDARCASVFPQVAAKDPKRIAALAKELRTLADASLPEKQFDAVVDTLILIAQDEIVESEWRNVIRSAIQQECEWASHRTIANLEEATRSSAANNTTKPRGSYDTARLAWVAPRQSPDNLIVQAAAAAISNESFPDFQQCRVAGRPFSEEIPGPVVLELISRALMRLEKSVSAAAPRLARLPLVHRPLFGLVLPGIYGWSSFHRSRPEWRIAFAAALLAASLVVLVLTLMLRSATVGAGIKVTLVLVALFTVTLWFWVFRPPAKSLLKSVSAVALAFIILSAVLMLFYSLEPLLRQFSISLP